MTPEEIQALAARIASLLAKQGWVPPTIRPEPPGKPTAGALPPWAGAGQSLSDVAPIPGRKTRSGPHRPGYDALVAAARGAAAGRGPSPLPGGSGAVAPDRVGGRTVSIGVSNRHIHVSAADFERLFGGGKRPTLDRSITQPGQYAAAERVRVVGPKGAIDGVRIVGPVRPHTQVELAASDCRRIGVDAPVRVSGNVAGSAGIRLEGPAGSVDLEQGAIVAARHLHLAPADAHRWGLSDGDRITVVLGSATRRSVLRDVAVRAGSKHATELHLDTDEANAFGVTTGDPATLAGRPTRRTTVGGRGGRPLVTERDVNRLAAEGVTFSDGGAYLMTPAAKDRAKALGLWRKTR